MSERFGVFLAIKWISFNDILSGKIGNNNSKKAAM